MHEAEIRQERLKKRANPGQALRLAFQIKLGNRNHFQIPYSQSDPQMNAISSQQHFCNANSRPIFEPRNQFTNQNSHNCGLSWSLKHKDKCFAEGITH